MSELAQNIEDRSRQVYHLRRGGMSHTEIAARLGISYAECIRDFRSFQKKAMAEFGPEDRVSLTQLEVDRLDALQLAVWDAAMAGDTKAVTSVLQIINTRTKLLGLDQLTVNDSTQLHDILIVGEAQQDFVEALTNGRKKLASPSSDDEDGVREA